MHRFYFEICIIPSNFFEIFASEILDFTKEAIEENILNEKPSIIIRTNKNKKFIESLIEHLKHISLNLTNINNMDISFKFNIHKKENKDWINTYKHSITPIESKLFYIHPPWEKETINKKKINIILEPSLAFGTGHHCSTYMCIQAIEACNINSKTTLLDMGCGSGILALCANKLGANVSLCDIDELAIEQSIKNFSNNNAKITQIWLGSADGSTAYDIVISNIVASVLINEKNHLINSLNNNSYLILSGILDKYKDDVLESFNKLELLKEYSKDEWICLKLFKN